MGKNIDEWHNFDSAETAKEFIAKDGTGKPENITAADKGVSDNNGGKTNETDENGTGSEGGDKGSENPVQNKQPKELVKEKTGDDQGKGKDGETKQVEKPKKKRITYDDLDELGKSVIDQGLVDLDVVNDLFGDYYGEEASEPVKSKDDEDVERVITDNILANESKELGERENAYNAIVEKFAESNPKAAEALGKYLTKHPEMRDLLIDMFDKHPQLLTSVVKDKKAKSGERTVYYVVYDGNEKPVKITNSMANIVSAFDGKDTATLDAYNKQQKAQKQQEESVEEDQKAADAAAKRAEKAQADLQTAQDRVLSKLKGEEKEKQQEEPVNRPEAVPQVKLSKEEEDMVVYLLNGLGEMNLKFKADDK